MLMSIDLRSILIGVMLLGTALSAQEPPSPQAESKARLSDQAIGLQVDAVPTRPAPILELGDPFLGRGPISEGFAGPGGSRWNPTFQLFGTFRTAAQIFDAGDQTFSEVATRLDLFGNLSLTQTERFLFGFRPLDDEGERFVGWNFAPEDEHGFVEAFDGRVSTLFFEGDLGEIFPDLDPGERGLFDFGFSVGRQPLRLQNGLFIEDASVDGFGLVRNTLKPGGFSNLRLTGFVGWNNLHRANRRRDDGATLVGLFSEADIGDSTVAVDLAWIAAPADTGDALYFAAASTQRLGGLSSTFRAAASVPLERDTPATRQGYLAVAELSWAAGGEEDLWYANAYWGIDDFSSALRAPDAGGPLARIGILYAAQGLGRYGSALDSEPQRSVGLGFGRQFFWDDLRQQLVLEAGGRIDTDGSDRGAAALGFRYQRAIGQHLIFQTDAFAALREERAPGFGFRVELLVKF
ncbi:MAG: hypothetical protein KDB53_03860 [Planctomycetes bacterium]|nr:hypothetical protein [Planctomycetota bacterium]